MPANSRKELLLSRGARTCPWWWLLRGTREEGGDDDDLHGTRLREVSIRPMGISVGEEHGVRVSFPPFFSAAQSAATPILYCERRSLLLRHVCWRSSR
jgi:hypothetical protein